MLTDVGTDGEVCIQRALKLVNNDLARLLECHGIPCFYTSSTGWVFHVASYLIGGTIPTSPLMLVENILLHLFLS